MSACSLEYLWEQRSVRLTVNQDLSPEQARDLATSLLYFARTADKPPAPPPNPLLAATMDDLRPSGDASD